MKTDEQRRARLIELISEHSLEDFDLMRLLDRRASTIRCWKNGQRAVPDHTIRLLEWEVSKSRV